MNVYDFDKTIFYPDSILCFLKWCVRRYPKIIFLYFPKLAYKSALYVLKRISVSEATEALFSFMLYVPNLEKEIEDFWVKNEKRIAPWYLAQKKDDDLIISASPEFFLKPIIKKLNVQLIGTQLDSKTGKVVGRCCYGKQKVKNLIKSEFFTNIHLHIDEFYSDSMSDFPLSLCAEKAFLVVNRGKTVKKWPKITERMTGKIQNINL